MNKGDVRRLAIRRAFPAIAQLRVGKCVSVFHRRMLVNAASGERPEQLGDARQLRSEERVDRKLECRSLAKRADIGKMRSRAAEDLSRALEPGLLAADHVNESAGPRLAGATR